MKYLVNLAEINLSHLNIVGGKNASIGEMIQNLSAQGIKVPGGYATTAPAFKEFLTRNKLDKKINSVLKDLKMHDLKALNKASAKIRHIILQASWWPDFENEVAAVLSTFNKKALAVRSSATVEDLPEASFAGQQETYLNVTGLKNLLHAIKLIFASLFTARAISYRHHHGFDYMKFAISAGIQPMVRSDKGASGVIFTLDTESGFDQVILITASYGLGEALVQGRVNPDEFLVYKPALAAGKFALLQRKLGEKAIQMVYTKKKASSSIKTIPVNLADRLHYCINDKEIHQLAKHAMLIEKHYGKAMDIEWAKDGLNGEIYILQARPETVKNKGAALQSIEQYHLAKKTRILLQGQSVGQRIGNGVARIIMNPKKISMLKPGEVLVTDMTDPDWEPIMKKASAIITNRGGRTCHAAIVARELGIPALVGCGKATTLIKEKDKITVSCADGQIGHVYEGIIPYTIEKINVANMPKLPLNLCINIGNPEKAFSMQFMPNDGVGLARLEFIIGNMIGIHPNAILNFKSLKKPLQKEIQQKTSAYKNPVEFYIEKLREGISMIAAAFYPKPVIFRFSDFKSDEYANLLGGNLYETPEDNPMLGFRGASRYNDQHFQPCFKLECEAFKRVHEKMNLTNAQLMVPFVRTVKEMEQISHLLETYGLKRGINNLKIYMMCEIPANVLLARDFLNYVDGFSIGSNDLTQLTLGIDRNSSLVAPLFDERDAAIKKLLHEVITICNQTGKYVGICGQAPSDYPDFAEWLMKEKIQSISLNPDTIVATWLMLAKKQSAY